MASLLTSKRPSKPRFPRLLHSGDRLTQAEFHRRYVAEPQDKKFELVGGVVYMASPVGMPHAEYHTQLGLVLGYYKASTPGVAVALDATVILGETSEPQPDACLRVLEDCGGQTRITKKMFLTGAPELVAEIAHSSVAIDLHQKKIDYQRAGVHEYLVLSVEEQKLHWFDFQSRRQIAADDRGILRSRIFPGLWIDGPALVARDSKRLIKAVEAGLASRDHAAFVQRLKSARRGR